MNLTTEQRQKYGTLLAKQRNLRNDLNQVENELSDFVLQIVGEPFTKTESKLIYGISKIKTVQTKGPNGFYQKATDQENKHSEDYKLLLEDLKTHGNKLMKDGFFCWLFNDKLTIGMKKSNH